MRVLVISDNIILYNKVKGIVNRVNPQGVCFDFKHSPDSSPLANHEDFIGRSATIDVNKEVELLIKSYDLIISLHCFQFFPEVLVKNVRCVNIHPGYNPVNRGWYPQVFAILYNLDIGATIHEMDAKLDNGPIIAREKVEKYSFDTSLSLYDRVLEKEIDLFEKYFSDIINNSYSTFFPEENGNFFSKKDFNNLCEVDLSRTGTFSEFYDYLRAMSHGTYQNLFFIDEKTGVKVKLKLEVSYE